MPVNSLHDFLRHNFYFLFLFDREGNDSREGDDDRYIKVTNDMVNLMAHLHQMKNRLLIYPRLCSFFFYHSNIKYNHELKALTNIAKNGK